jgi:hypothetical protein
MNGWLADYENGIEFRLLEDSWILSMNSKDERANWMKRIENIKDLLIYEELTKRGAALLGKPQNTTPSESKRTIFQCYIRIATVPMDRF